MSDFEALRETLVEAVLGGEGKASNEQRRAAFDGTGLPEPIATLVENVAHKVHAIRDEDIASALRSGFTEDQLFEIIVCATVGHANRVHESAWAALDSAMGGKPA